MGSKVEQDLNLQNNDNNHDNNDGDGVPTSQKTPLLSQHQPQTP
jgi:hypothetical protein